MRGLLTAIVIFGLAGMLSVSSARTSILTDGPLAGATQLADASPDNTKQ